MYGTLVGVGGGALLVPVLLMMMPDESPATITSISLGVVFFNAYSGTVAYVRMGRVDYRSAVLFSAAGLPGAVVGVLLWLGVSRLFGLYVDVAGNYDRMYGTLGGVIVFLVWLWLSSMALLVGAEVNQVLVERRTERLAIGKLVPSDRAERVEQQVKLAGGDLGG